MSVEVDIAEAFIARLNALVLVPALTILSEGVTTEQGAIPNNARYIEYTHFRNTNRTPTWTGGKELIGIFQINVVDPLKQGDIVPSEIAAIVAEWFKKDTRLTYGATVVKIELHPTCLTPVQDLQKRLFPISIPYRCDTL